MNKIATLITTQTIDNYILQQKTKMLNSLNLIDQYIKANENVEDIINIYNSILSNFNMFSNHLMNLINNIGKENKSTKKEIKNEENNDLIEFEL